MRGPQIQQLSKENTNAHLSDKKPQHVGQYAKKIQFVTAQTGKAEAACELAKRTQKHGEENRTSEENIYKRRGNQNTEVATGFTFSSSFNKEKGEQQGKSDTKEKQIREKLSWLFANIPTKPGHSDPIENCALYLMSEYNERESVPNYDANQVGEKLGGGDKGIVFEYGQRNKWVVKFWKHPYTKYINDNVLAFNYYYGENTANAAGKNTCKLNGQLLETTIMIRMPGVNLKVATDPNYNRHGKLLDALQNGAVEDFIYELAEKHAILNTLALNDFIFDPDTMQIHPIDFLNAKFYYYFNNQLKEEFEKWAIQFFLQIVVCNFRSFRTASQKLNLCFTKPINIVQG